MKKLFFASLWVLACLTAACSDEKDEPNGESGSVVGEWVFQKNEYYRNGKMIDSFTAGGGGGGKFYGCGGRG